MEPDQPRDEAPALTRTLLGDALVARRISSVAHDLASPLSTISLRSELLLGRFGKLATPEAEKDARAVRTILEAATRCNQLLTALRNHARLPAAGSEPLVAGPLVAEALELVASPARHKGLTLTVLELDRVRWRAPRGWLQQVVLGLVAYAVTWAEARSPLQVVGVTEGGSCGIELRLRGTATGPAHDRDLEAAQEAAHALGATISVEADATSAVLRLLLPQSATDSASSAPGAPA